MIEIERLRQASVAKLSDAIDRITGKQFVLSHAVQLQVGTKVFGPAVPIMVAITAERAEHKSGNEALKGAAAGSVIVAGVDDELDAAIWGDSEFQAGLDSGVAGFITDGSVRQVESFGSSLAIFSAGRSPASGFGRLKTMAANVKISCGGVDVRPGDYIAGDADGVIVLPKERLTDIAAALA